MSEDGIDASSFSTCSDASFQLRPSLVGPAPPAPPAQPSLSRERVRIVERLVGTLLPVVYIWSLPFLAETGWVNKCEMYPKCEWVGLSVSNYISTPQATGAMAGLFYYPCIHMWMNAKEVDYDRCVYLSLLIFQFAFGLFLSAPIVEYSNMHGMSVVTFCVASLFHFRAMMRHCLSKRLWKCRVLLWVSSFAFMQVFVLTFMSHMDHRILIDNCPWLFYMTEALGLSSQAIFPMLWFYDPECEQQACPSTPASLPSPRTELCGPSAGVVAAASASARAGNANSSSAKSSLGLGHASPGGGRSVMLLDPSDAV